MLKRCAYALVTICGLATSAAATAEVLTLMVLEHAERGQRVQTKVEAKPGAALAPLRGKTLERVSIFPGNPLVTEQRPRDQVVELYRGVDVERSLLCAVAIRYFRDARGLWVPHFELIEEALVIRGANGRWQPLNIARGAAALIVLTSSTLPNAEGFYPALEFGMTSGTFQIDSWVVR
jgi:hypothetical protein